MTRVQSASVRTASAIRLLAWAIPAILFAAVVLFAAPGRVLAASPEEIRTAVKSGGTVIVFRHGATHPDQADTDPLHFGDTTRQRQLSAAGRKQAEDLGALFARAGLRLGTVQSSMFQRAAETAKLLSGREPDTRGDITEGGLVVSPNENARRAAAFRALVAVAPAGGTNTLIVSHKPNIMDAFGRDWFDLQEGEASIFRPDGKGGVALLGRVKAKDWPKLLQ